jgi:general secretion pathway protein N
MPKIIRIPRILAASLCLDLLIGAPDIFASPADQPAAPPLATAAPAPGSDVDALISTIQDRPLFTAGRHPPAPPVQESDVPAQPVVKAPPEVRGRLAGVTLGPDDQRWAVFARQGDKPAVVKEGEEIDGWTVSAIEPSRVVLKSEFGEKVMMPTPSVAGEGALPAVLQQAARRQMPVPSQPPQLYRPGAPGFPNIGNVPNPVPSFVRPPPVAAQRPAGVVQRRSQR